MGQFYSGEWNEVSPGVFQGRCPGEHLHSKGSAGTDCRLFCGYGPKGEKPGAFCLHNSCRGVLDELNGRFRDAIFAKDPNYQGSGGRPVEEGVVKRPPRPREGWIPEYDHAKLKELVRAVPAVNEAWFEERSPIDPRGVTPGEFLERVFAPGERAVVFTEYKSQGDYLWEVGRGGYRLSDQRGVKAVRSKLPTDGGTEGVWFLSNPADGQWHMNPRREGRYSRRSEEAVTAWRHLVLECDEEKTLRKKAGYLREAHASGLEGKEAADFLTQQSGRPKWAEEVAKHPERWLGMAEQFEAWAPEVAGLWMRFLAMCPVPVKAIYSSGGASWHALVVVDYPTKAAFDTFLRSHGKRLLPIFGADPAAMTPVRLTRLPGCTRRGKLQRLIYLNPGVVTSDERTIRDFPKLRSV
jgi:hypothetical protein